MQRTGSAAMGSKVWNNVVDENEVVQGQVVVGHITQLQLALDGFVWPLFVWLQLVLHLSWRIWLQLVLCIAGLQLAGQLAAESSGIDVRVVRALSLRRKGSAKVLLAGIVALLALLQSRFLILPTSWLAAS